MARKPCLPGKGSSGPERAVVGAQCRARLFRTLSGEKLVALEVTFPGPTPELFIGLRPEDAKQLAAQLVEGSRRADPDVMA